MPKANIKTNKNDDDPTIVAARVQEHGVVTVARIGVITTLIATVGGIIVALANPDLIKIFLYGETSTPVATIIYEETNLPPSLTLTNTPPALLFTKTRMPTSVPDEPTSTAFPTSIPGKDWMQNCIDLTTWSPYLAGAPAPAEDNCAQLAPWGITAQNSSLFLNSLTSQSTAYEYGIAALLPSISEIDLMVSVKKLEDSEVWVGILNADESEKLRGYIFVIQPGASMDFRDISSQKTIVDNQFFTYVDSRYPVTIKLDAGKISILVNGNKLITDYPVTFNHRKLFIGYRSLPGTQIDVTISHLKIGTQK